MPFTIVCRDITKIKADAIVNAANTELAMGGGVCGAIFRAAGAAKLQAACDKLKPIKTGEAVVTPAFDLPAKYIIHTAGPVYSRYSEEENRRLLLMSYLNSLQAAFDRGCESIVFPLISSGIYGYPKGKALETASEAIGSFLSEHDMNVCLAVVDRNSLEFPRRRLEGIERYIDENYIHEKTGAARSMPFADIYGAEEALSEETEYIKKKPEYIFNVLASEKSKGIDDVVSELEEPFNVSLLHLIDSKGKTDAEVYKKANIDRKLFSKIRTGKGYMPGKRTVLALAIALELDLDETDKLLEKAGYALSHSQKFDVIVEYFIINGNYSIYEINEVLFRYGQPLLGAN